MNTSRIGVTVSWKGYTISSGRVSAEYATTQLDFRNDELEEDFTSFPAGNLVNVYREESWTPAALSELHTRYTKH